MRPASWHRWSPRPTQHGLEVWLDVVFNHTAEADPTKPTLSLRGLDEANAYLHRDDGTYNDDSGCGNVSNPADPYIQRLVLTALDRFADLGIDGFRFDLASLLTRDGGVLVDRITEWGAQRGVRLIAEPWDLGRTRSASGRSRGCNGTITSATRSAASFVASRAWCQR